MQIGKSEFLSKQEAIKEILKDARAIKQQYNNHQKPCNPLYCCKYYNVTNQEYVEHWKIEFFVNEKVSTKPHLSFKQTEIEYPKTTWGETYSRWDSELKKFLEREIFKI